MAEQSLSQQQICTTPKLAKQQMNSRTPENKSRQENTTVNKNALIDLIKFGKQHKSCTLAGYSQVRDLIAFKGSY